MLKANQNSDQKISRAALLLIASMTMAISAASYAQDVNKPDNADASITAIPAPSPSATPPTAQQTENVRMRALEGSRSRWSGQFNLTYFGSSINHPLAEEAPNPGNQSVHPVVSLGGTVSARYRIDETTTAGLGTGVTTYTPFQGPSNTSVSNPQVDVAHSFKFAGIHNRADFLMNGYTDNQYHTQLGYIVGLTALNEAYYTFPFGLTTGLLVELDWNFFSGHAGYSPDGQTVYDVFTDPYFEFTLSKRVNLRSVIGIQALSHQNDMHTPFAQYHQKIYQTLGVGISIMDGFFIYPYLNAGNYTDMNTRTVIFGFNTIIDLF